MTESRYVVVDGLKRVRCLHRLHRDTVAAVVWEMAACEALIFRHLLRSDATENVFEQAWLLRTLHEEHGLALDVVARRLDRSVSWVSRRLSLVRTLPDTVQQQVREGHIVAHAAMKYLVPLARAKRDDCVRLADAVAPHRLTTRQMGRLYQHYIGGPEVTRTLVLTDPLLVLRLSDDATPARLRPEASAGSVDRGFPCIGRRGPAGASPTPAGRRLLAAGTRAGLERLRPGPGRLSGFTTAVPTGAARCSIWDCAQPS